MLKNKNFLLTVILPIIISIFVGLLIIVLNSKSILNTRAATVVAGEKKEMTDKISSLKEEKETLQYTAAEYDKTLEDNRLLLDEITTLTEDLNEYTTSIEDAKKTIESLDNTIKAKAEYNESLKSIVSETAGESKSYSNVKLSSPSDIKQGRYKAEGTGTLLIYSIAGTLEDKQNLSVIDSHSYVFNIISGQSVKVEGTLTITEISDQ